MGTTRQDRGAMLRRRVVAGLTAAVFFALMPAVAQAAFKATANGSLTSSTYAVPAPASMTATATCAKPSTLTLDVSGYGKVAKATAYVLTITAPDNTSTSQTITGDTATMVKSSKGRGIYTVTLQALVGSWTGAPLTSTYDC